MCKCNITTPSVHTKLLNLEDFINDDLDMAETNITANIISKGSHVMGED